MAVTVSSDREHHSRRWRILEFGFLFLLVPSVMALLKWYRIAPIPILITASSVCLIVLLRDPGFHRRQLGHGLGWKQHAKTILIRFGLSAAVMTGVVLWLEPDNFLTFVKRVPLLWLMVMILYPLLSAYPQELIYRAFFFHRYRVLFPRRWMMLLASAVAFGYLHIIFRNWPAVVLTIPAGYFFAHTYDRTRSTVACALEHGLYGDFIFTIGLGLHFYHGVLH